MKGTRWVLLDIHTISIESIIPESEENLYTTLGGDYSGENYYLR